MLEELYQKLNYRFGDPRLLITALTHPSYGGDHHVPHYQRLEFLGDAVLELAISEYLYRELPEVDDEFVQDVSDKEAEELKRYSGYYSHQIEFGGRIDGGVPYNKAAEQERERTQELKEQP